MFFAAGDPCGDFMGMECQSQVAVRDVMVHVFQGGSSRAVYKTQHEQNMANKEI